MSFLKLILKNPFRKRSSAILAIIGIGIGIATIVALGAITEGMISSFEDTIHAGGADFTITGKDTGKSAYGTSTIGSNWTDKIASIPGVESAYPIYVALATVSNNPYFTLIGIDPDGVSNADLSITDGRLYNDDANEIVIGKLAAENDNYSVGDSLSVNGENFKIVGIYETGDQQNDASSYTSIKTVSRLMDDTDHVSNIYVKVDKDVDVQSVADDIEAKYGDSLTVVTSVMEMGQMADMLNGIKSASAAISLLAIIVGGLGIINTMLMSVLERTRELGVLKAMGWSNKRVLTMIIAESLVITIVAGIVGSIVGVLLVEFLGSIIGFKGIYSLSIFLQAFLIAIIVGIVGGLYPAVKAVKLPPTEALRYE